MVFNIYNNFIKSYLGFLKTKNLIENRENYINKLVTECSVLQKPLIVAKDTNLLEMLMIFQDKKGTLAMINEEVRKKKSVIQKNEEIFFSVNLISKYIYIYKLNF